MEQILIPQKRAKILEEISDKVEQALKCKVKINEENTVLLHGEPYNEFEAKRVIQAFGRGFDIERALSLLSEEYFSKYIDLRDMFRNEGQIKRIKARIIGKNGKAKSYIEEASGVVISVYGDTIGLIGRTDEIEIASSALQILIDGGTHKKAYRIMEGVRRKYRSKVIK